MVLQKRSVPGEVDELWLGWYSTDWYYEYITLSVP